MNNETFNDFYLVGGTALALWLGHRKSIDLDFFIHSDLDSRTVAYFLENNFNAKNIEGFDRPRKYYKFLPAGEKVIEDYIEQQKFMKSIVDKLQSKV